MEKPIKYYIRKWINEQRDHIEISFCILIGFVIPVWVALGLFWEFSFLSFISVICMMTVCWISASTVLEYCPNIFDYGHGKMNFFNFWWYPFHKSINMKEYFYSNYNLEDWCMEYCHGPFEYDNHENWYFLYESDLVAFKLTWAK